jgi:hypothetical protein
MRLETHDVQLGKETGRRHNRVTDAATIAWLLRGDPAIRWQTLRDLVGADARTVVRERRSVESKGWGARLLAHQDSRETWDSQHSSDGGMYLPKWTSTVYSMLLLRDFGLLPGNVHVARACRLLLDHGLQDDGSIAYGAWAKRHGGGETCVTGMVLSLLSYFRLDDPRIDSIASHLLASQMEDGGWNCRRVASHSSVNTTISVLEGLRMYELNRHHRTREIRATQTRGREFLLAHRLFRSHRTGRVIKSEFTQMVFPPRWHYDVLRALDHFQSVGAARDERLADAIELVRRGRARHGRWRLERRHKGKTFFELERVGAPSRWNTLRALRVLSWWNSIPTVRSSKS